MNKLLQIPNQVHLDFNEYLSNHSFEGSPKELYDPINYFMGLGGKRLRPVVLLLSSYLFSGKYRHAMPAALAIELFHNFTLVHDDVMDDAPLRRGQTTIHEKYGLNTSILSGDVMMVHAFNFLLKLEDLGSLNKIMEIFAKQAIEVCEGQQMDMNFETESNVAIDEYLRMIELKTSVLVGASMQIGALLGGAFVEDTASVYHFGRNLGIAFQLQDDLLDTYGDPVKFGKKVGGDIIQKKKTILYLKALELGSGNSENELRRLYNSNDLPEKTKIQKVINVYDELDIKHHTREIQEKYQCAAFEQLEKLQIEGERKEMMKNFAIDLMNRQL